MPRFPKIREAPHSHLQTMSSNLPPPKYSNCTFSIIDSLPPSSQSHHPLNWGQNPSLRIPDLRSWALINLCLASPSPVSICYRDIWGHASSPVGRGTAVYFVPNHLGLYSVKVISTENSVQRLRNKKLNKTKCDFLGQIRLVTSSPGSPTPSPPRGNYKLSR